MPDQDEYHAAITLGLLPGIGHCLARKLMQHCHSAQEVFQQSSRQLKTIPGIGPKIAAMLRHSNLKEAQLRAEQEVNFCLQERISIVTCNDPRFPYRLLHCSDGPYLLYMKGEMNLNDQRMVAVVGSRSASAYGKRLTEELIEGLKGCGVAVVSGLAIGIDGKAHLACLDHGLPTAAVLAHGLDMIYPAVHQRLARNIIERNGCLISEFKSETTIERMQFPSRNRIVAGMCDAVIVVESARKGGGLITADIANSYDRDVFAFPGRTTDNLSSGCHALIRQHRAALIESASDLMYMMDWHHQKSNLKRTDRMEELEGNEKVIYQSIIASVDGIHIDQLMRLPDIGGEHTLQLLLNLEFKGFIRSLPGSSFAKA